MEQIEVLRVLDLLDAHGIPHWIEGGWGIDALAGRQTRDHDDLDVCLDETRLDDAVGLLAAAGYQPETDWLPVRLQLANPGFGAVDLHPLRLDAAGNGRQAGPDGTHFDYPGADLGIGWLDGRLVRTVSAPLQREFHAGYPLRDKDTHDLAVLDMVDARLESAFVVEIPVADPVVHSYRIRLDRGAALGVPAHLTVLFPFAPQQLIDATIVQRGADICRGLQPFDVTLSGTGWFDQDALWLAPDDLAPFQQLTCAFAAAFPSYPPYRGAFDGSVPHLTIGDRAPLDVLRDAEHAVRQHLPLRQPVKDVSLFAGSDELGSWLRLQRFPLG